MENLLRVAQVVATICGAVCVIALIYFVFND